jgi:peptidoglycan/xylan/chitin deacetylase (PgdA/CDA1 family)
MVIVKLKFIVKHIIAYFLFYTGLLHVLKFIKLRDKSLVLMYHRVLSEEMRDKAFSHSGIIVDLKTFEMQIRYINKAFRVLTHDEFTAQLSQGTRYNKTTCLITFDDGWKDNYAHAYPVLKKYKTPAIIFLPVNYIDSSIQFWQEQLTRILIDMHHAGVKDADEYRKNCDMLKKYNLQGIMNLSEDRLRVSIERAVSEKKKMSYEEIESMVAQLSEHTKFKRTGQVHCDFFLSWDEIYKMKECGISFGSHGMNHKILTKVPLSEANYEIAESKRVIENRIGKDVSSISYPNGDYEKDVIELVKTHGYNTAFSTESGFVDMADNPYFLKRINIHNDVTDNIPMFLSVILGVF